MSVSICYPVVMTERDFVYFQLRLPSDMHAEFKRMSEADERSVHWEVLRALRAGLAQLRQSAA